MIDYFKQKDIKSIKPVDLQYASINNPDYLFKILLELWDEYTCAPRMANDWCIDNPTLGQCSITAFLVQDIFGGDVYGIDLADGNYHCYNVINDIVFDLTSDQFKDKLCYSRENIQSRDTHFKKKEKYQRYLFLKKKLNNYLCSM